MGVMINRSYLQASSDQSRHRSRALRHDRAVARRLLPRREDRLHRQPGAGHRRWVRAAGRRPAAVLAARRRRRRAILQDDGAASIATSRFKSFDFSLDPGTGPMAIKRPARRPAPVARDHERRRDAHRNAPADGAAGADAERRPPPRQRRTGRRHDARSGRCSIRRRCKNAPVTIAIGEREVVTAGVRRPIPAFKVEMTFQRSHHHGVGDRYRRDRARREPDGPDHGARDAGAGHRARRVEPHARGHARGVGDRAGDGPPQRIVEPRDVKRLRLRLTGADLVERRSPGRRADGRRRRDRVDRSAATHGRARRRADLDRYLQPEPFIESDAPEIRAEAERMVAGRHRRSRARRAADARSERPGREEARR